MEESKLDSKLDLIGFDLESNNNSMKQNDIKDEAETSDKASSEKPSLFVMKSANQTVADALSQPDPRPLYHTYWIENENTCLFADSHAGKTVFAVQMADWVTKHNPNDMLLYFDFEMSDKQFQLRCTDKANKKVYQFADNFIRVYTNPDAFLTMKNKFEEVLIKGIEALVDKHKAKYVIIDNISVLCEDKENGKEATRLMNHINALVKKYKFSLLVLAHSPKRDESRPITQNDLGGSKMLFNFFDGVFAIGKSRIKDVRYTKQLKARTRLSESGLKYYIDDEVEVHQIKQIDGLVQFVHQEDGQEIEHLKKKESISDDILEQAKELKSQGKSYKQIAKDLNVSKSTVYKKLNKCDNDKEQ